MVTKRYLPEGSIAAERGPEPPGVGVPVSDNVPSEATLKMEIVFVPTVRPEIVLVRALAA